MRGQTSADSKGELNGGSNHARVFASHYGNQNLTGDNAFSPIGN